MPERLDYYKQQAKAAFAHAAKCKAEDQVAWLRIAADWQALHDTLSRNLGLPPQDLSKEPP